MIRNIFGLFFIGLFVFLAGCNRDVVNLREMTPEEQFNYAKRIYDREDYYKAKMQFTVVALNNAGSKNIDKTQYYLADSHFHLKEYIQAIAEFEKLIRSMPQSEYVDDARYKVGMCYFKLSPGYALDQEYTLKALSQFQMFLDEFPDSELRPEVDTRYKECREKLAKKEYKSGELYQKMGQYPAAIIYYEHVVREFTDTSFIDDALYHKGECHIKMHQLEEAETAFSNLIRKYSDSSFAQKADSKRNQVRKLIAEQLEKSAEG
ncbi:outer membrane protein assembly factor BamD [candidate division KSB1 bacterium]|nr:outer membrane protein assembly factor BamD [candidate division KSB1 bacterium]